MITGVVFKSNKTKYDFIKYKNTTKNNMTYFNSATSMNMNTTGQKANTIILGTKLLKTGYLKIQFSNVSGFWFLDGYFTPRLLINDFTWFTFSQGT